jgi:ATP-binding cassette, subfamily B, bacterial HlyB/CyaB
MIERAQQTRAEAPFGGGLTALARVAAFHGVPTTAAQLAHRLALGDQALQSEDLVRGAKLLGLKARIVRRPRRLLLEEIPVPAILKLKDGKWGVLGVELGDGRFRVVDPLRGRVSLLTAEEVLDGLDKELLIVGRRNNTSGALKGGGLSWFSPSIKRYRSSLAHVLVATLLVQSFALTTPLFFQLIVDKVMVHKSYSTLVVLIAGMISLAVFDAVLKFLRTYVLSHASNRIQVELGARLFSHLFRLPLAYFEERPAGHITSRMREVDTIRSFLAGQALTSAIDLPFTLMFLVVLFAYSHYLTFIVLLTLPFYVATVGLMRRPLRAKMRARFNAWSATQQLAVESIVGVQTVKAAAVEPIVQQAWEEKLAGYARTSFEAALLGAAGANIVGFLTRVSTALILYFGAQLVIEGSLTLGGLIAFNMIAAQVNQPILRLARLWQDFQQVQVSLERLGDILNTPFERQGRSLPALAIPRGEIRFDRVRFRYQPHLPDALKDISLSIDAGAVIGIIGPSGSGKSTLAKLLQRFYLPDAGQISLDGIDIAQFDPAWLRQQLGVVLQENVLFNRTIHENIALARPNMPRAQVVRLAQLAGADEFVSKLPLGYDTQIVERGANLSGGQRQRIAIARALATNPRVLIFDEATSALDYESEQIIHANMRKIVEGRTAIIISHRLGAVRCCDRIIGLSDGAIVESGTHAELLARRDGLYARLWSLQSEVSPASRGSALISQNETVGAT